MAFPDLVGRKIGKSTVLARGPADAGGNVRWLVQCEYGVQTHRRAGNLRRYPHCKFCNPRRAPVDCIAVKSIPEYVIWKGMKARCHGSVRGGHLKYYKERGVIVCARWRESFAAFLADMGPRPSPKHSIDRYPNNEGNYEPGNCRWATPAQQAASRRPRSGARRYA